MFDQGYIGFEDSGVVMVADDLVRTVLERWGIDADRNVGQFKPEQRVYLKYHREERFGKKAVRGSGQGEES